MIIAEIDCPIFYIQEIEKEKEKEGYRIGLANLQPIPKNSFFDEEIGEEMGTCISFHNHSPIPIKYYEGILDDSIDDYFWKNVNGRVHFEGGDSIRISKGYLSAIIYEILPMEEIEYCILSNGAGYCKRKGKKFSVVSSFKPLSSENDGIYYIT